MNAIHETSKSLDLPQLRALEISALQRFCSLLAQAGLVVLVCSVKSMLVCLWCLCPAVLRAKSVCVCEDQHGRDSFTI